MTERNNEYEVGCGRPPRHSQFVKGESGNKNGRPPKSKGLRQVIVAELNRKIRVTENGKTRAITKGDAMGMRLVESALKGDLKALATILGMVGDNGAIDAKRPRDISPSGKAMIEAWKKRIRDARPD